MGSYIPSTAKQREEMLSFLGINNINELYSDVPQQIFSPVINLPKGMSEMEVLKTMQEYAQENHVFSACFRGAGAYDRYIPSIVKRVTAKEEFLTAYTPYQAEISQGILQSIFEYQTMICELTGMQVANASVYDGASAAAEAAAMCRDTKRSRTLVSAGASPFAISTIKTYCFGANASVEIVPTKNGKTDLSALATMLCDTDSAFYFAQPNYYGNIEDAEAIAEIVHKAGAKLIMDINPIAAPLLKTPGEIGADIAVGEGQPLGMPLSFGGPYLGFMAANTALTRKLPGRIVGETVDTNGERAFVLTLQAREQHIRREKASSNICSNEALCAMTAAVYMAAMGKTGMCKASKQCYDNAHYLADKLCSINGFKMAYDADFFCEFVLDCGKNAQKLLSALEREDILGGLPLDNGILWCATEKNTKEQMDTVIRVAREVANQ
ncbi:MAG: aminomethyl-transferring glycine dehydrogenase subunit GcvPA [Oscillospiraceae bacterium]